LKKLGYFFLTLVLIFINHKIKTQKMKKVLFVFAIAAAFAACNDSSKSAETTVDSTKAATEAVVDSTKAAASAVVDSTKAATSAVVDSTKAAAKGTVDSVKAAVKH
jgi:hypothetical protein